MASDDYAVHVDPDTLDVYVETAADGKMRLCLDALEARDLAARLMGAAKQADDRRAEVR